jgi:hypothetical protein
MQLTSHGLCVMVACEKARPVTPRIEYLTRLLIKSVVPYTSKICTLPVIPASKHMTVAGSEI